MKKSIFEYRDYKTYLKDWLKKQVNRGHGERIKLAQALGCQSTYISQVLNYEAQFSLEQADKINSYLGHTKDEGHFFILLVELMRAGTPSLKKYFDLQIKEIHQRRLVLKDRLDVRESLTVETQTTYYSQWYYSAIHVMLSIPAFQTRAALSDYLRLPLKTISEALEFLTSLGLAREEGGRFFIGTNRIHLGAGSPMLSRHHINWRMKSIQSLERSEGEDLHYSSAITLSKDDVIRLKSLFVDLLEDTKSIVKSSKEEEAFCFSLDFFKI